MNTADLEIIATFMGIIIALAFGFGVVIYVFLDRLIKAMQTKQNAIEVLDAVIFDRHTRKFQDFEHIKERQR